MKSVAITQSNYIPWKGYFDLISSVDEFVIYDCVQYTRRDWRNRNLVKTPNGLLWLTVPVETRGKYLQSIKETKVADNDWLRKHFQTIVHNYGKAPYFEEMHQWLTNLYMPRQYSTISEWNHHFITKICELLGIKTRISFSYEYSFTGGKTQKLLQICNQAKASVYVTGPRAKNYLDLALMNSHGVEVRFFKYENYPTYSQLWGEFEHKVSIVDLILNCGTNIQKFMRSLS